MRVSDTVRKCALFVGIDAANGEIVYGGTAFIVSVPGERKQQYGFTYAVTARHVIEKIQQEIGSRPFVIRGNKTDGTSVLFNAAIDQWFFHPDPSVDIAVSIFAPPPGLKLDIRHIPLDNFITDDDIKKNAIGAGDEVFMTGLFTKAVGSSQNMPIVRMGNIALMPSELIPHGGVPIEAYLIEARSIGGLSGSPAFVSATVTIPYDIPNMPKKWALLWLTGQSFFLGLVRGHWDVLPNRSLLEAEKVNMGISVIVPAKKIMEALYLPEQVEMRKKIEEERMKEDESATTDTEFMRPNAISKQAFEAALKKVSRKIKSKKK
jgi:hypothetical protein